MWFCLHISKRGNGKKYGIRELRENKISVILHKAILFFIFIYLFTVKPLKVPNIIILFTRSDDLGNITTEPYVQPFKKKQREE